MSVTLLKAAASVQLSRRPGLSAVENIKCNQLHLKRSCTIVHCKLVPAVIATRGATYHKCRMGVAACKTASIAPPLSRNQTLCSSSKICISVYYVYYSWHHSGEHGLRVNVCSLTCLQVFPASDVINIPAVVDNSGPIFPEKRSDHFPAATCPHFPCKDV